MLSYDMLYYTVHQVVPRGQHALRRPWAGAPLHAGLEITLLLCYIMIVMIALIILLRLLLYVCLLFVLFVLLLLLLL